MPTTVWMGISMGCVTCHEHKFDPFEMKDFYQLFAFFNSLDGPVMDGNKPLPPPIVQVPSPANQPQIDRLAGEIGKLKEQRDARAEAASEEFDAWAAAMRAVPKARVVEPADGVVSPRGQRKVVIELDDGITPRKSWGWERRLILKDSIVIRVGGKKLPFELDEKSNRVTVQLPADTKAGTVNLEVQFENLFKHSNTRPRVRLRMKPWNN